MKISHKWLQRYLKCDLDPVDLAERLSMLGLEFDSVDRPGERYRGFVVGKVLECDLHPNANKLTVCRVDVGAEVLQVVCGAPNVSAGQNVAVGLVGATVPKNQHDVSGKPLVLERVKIRGVESSGMICSEFELDLGKDAEGILVLGDDARVGQQLAEYLGLDDVVYDVEVTPNRPDWLSHFGIAREIGVIVKRRPKLPVVKLKETRTPITDFLNITVQDKRNCLRFAARMIRNTVVGPSPSWLQNALRSVGLRPRNNVVDITNYVMLEYGQPLHAFDYSLLKGGEIVVRQTEQETQFLTLDGKERQLPAGTVMVCDAEREVSIAGVMGGANSEINDMTRDIVIESANWNPASIRRTSKALGISTDASQRFERGADPNAVVPALERAAGLVAEIAGGELLKGRIDRYTKNVREKVVPLRPARANAVLGTSLSDRETVRLLGLLGIYPARKSRGRVFFTVPTYRVDIDREIDLIEEVARVYGYDNIDAVTTGTVDFDRCAHVTSFAEVLREGLIALGYQEAVTNSMQQTEKSALGGCLPVSILNPQNNDMASLRSSLVPGLLDAAALNHSQGNFDLRLFEIGHVFCVDTSARPKFVENFLEEERVCMLLTGMIGPRQWGTETRAADVFDLKGEFSDLLEKIALDKGKLIYYSTSNTLAENALAVEINGSYAGFLGSIRAEVLKKFGIEQEVFAVEATVRLLDNRRTRRYQQLPRFPRVKRDVAFVVELDTPAQSVEDAIRAASTGLLQEVELFDVYQGENLPPGKKSLAFAVVLMSADRTLKDSEIDAEIRRIVIHVEKQFGASLRSISQTD